MPADAAGQCAAALSADAQIRGNAVVLAQRLGWAVAYILHLVDAKVVGAPVDSPADPSAPAAGPTP